MAGAIQETCSSEMFGGQGAEFPKRGCALEHQIFRFAHMNSRDRCSTSYDPASLLRGRHSISDRHMDMEWKNCKMQWCEAVSFAFSFPFLKEAAQNCFDFDVVNFEN